MDNVEIVKNKSKKDWVDKQAKEFVNDKLLKTFITTLLMIAGLTSNNEYQSLRDGNPLNYWNIIFIIFLCIIIYAGYQVAYRNMNKLTIAQNIREYQAGVQKSIFDITDYMVNDMLPDANTTEEKLKIINEIPNVFGLIPVETLQKTSASGFQLIVEMLSANEIRAKDNASKLFNSIEGSIKKTTNTFKSLMDGKVVVDENPVADPLLPKELQEVPSPPTDE